MKVGQARADRRLKLFLAAGPSALIESRRGRKRDAAIENTSGLITRRGVKN